MRKLLAYIIMIICASSCAKMHEPVLHAGGMIRFIPAINYDVDSIAIKRMQDFYIGEWSKSIFYKELNDFHINWFNNSYSNEIDFIDESHDIKSPYGEFRTLWSTNPYNNNIQRNGYIYTETLGDLIHRIPDFVYSQRSDIIVSDNRHDYINNDGKHIQIFNETLEQCSFLYIVQVKLKNNKNIIKNSGTFMISGLAEGYDINESKTYGNVSHTFNTKYKDNIITGAFISFGISGYNAYDIRYNTRNNIREYNTNNKLFIQIIYNNNRRIIEIDVSNQILLQPTGGLILVELDMNDYPEPDEETKDPFNIFVDDYENTEHYFTNF